MAIRKRSTEKEEFWRMVLAEFESSGLSVREFCRREKLGEASLYSWRREIARRDAGSEGVKLPTASLVPVTVVDAVEAIFQPTSHGSAGCSDVEVVTADGLTIRLGNAVTTERLRVVLSMVTQLVQGEVGC